jgi:hypothetical protein
MAEAEKGRGVATVLTFFSLYRMVTDIFFWPTLSPERQFHPSKGQLQGWLKLIV